MKKQNKIMLGIIFSVLLIGIINAGVGLYSSRDNPTIDIAKPQQDILEARNITDITISQLKCYEEEGICKSCSQASSGYRMGCIEIKIKKCTEYETNSFNSTSCIGDWVDKTEAEKEISEREAYEIIWEDIADVIVERENKVVDIIFDEGSVQIREKT